MVSRNRPILTSLLTAAALTLIALISAVLRFGAVKDSDDPKYVAALLKGSEFRFSETRFRRAGFQDPLNFYRFKAPDEAAEWLIAKYKLIPRSSEAECSGMDTPSVSAEAGGEVVPPWWSYDDAAARHYRAANDRGTCCYSLHHDPVTDELFFQEACI